ncbi:hypothetical protein RU89_GL001355 [Lactococcus cremoris]|nr:hypothetical protein llh_2045 [Lactococcus cremoris subsp. cremoris A76]KZK14511.1 hypothetical protein AB995_0010 [Lactococcus cremoris]KZK35765.1 hypothetical protein LMG6897_2049 [Lactococcus cremoris]KZK43746.1 hypothetical protein B40_1457 [Lactococcus cremoris]KZK47902.1 hypothetical protein SK110_0900 [Lactococcus cremoris]
MTENAYALYFFKNIFIKKLLTVFQRIIIGNFTTTLSTNFCQ